MNLFDYRNKKDLRSRTTDFREGREEHKATTQPAKQPKANAAPSHANSRVSRARVRNRTSDKWVYDQKIEQYRLKQTNGPAAENKPNVPQQVGESKADYDQRYDRYRRLLSEWFSGEVIKSVFRRHWMHIFYIGKLAWILVPITLLVTALAFFLPFLFIVAVIVWAIQLAALAWVINDWLNDYLIMTDRRIIYLEKTSFFEKTKIEIPIDHVQGVKTETNRSFVEYFFRVGTVKISSSGKTAIVFKHLYEPERIRKEYGSLRRSYLTAHTSFRKDRMNNYLENKIWGTKLINWNANEESRALRIKEEQSWLERLIPSGPIREGKDIVWYHHPIVLIKKIILPLLAIPVILVAGIFGIPFLFTLHGGLGTLGIVIFLAVLAIDLFIIWFRYDDWHNDRYIMSDDKITDIVKLPFGFDETQSSVEIRNVQDTEYEKRGFWANQFNYGTVKVTTIGGPALHFKNIPNPEIVEDEVSRRKEMLKHLDEDRQDRLMADFFAAYRDILLHPEEHAPSDEYGMPHRLDQEPPKR